MMLIVDAPEVLQRTLADALSADGIPHRLLPDTRSDAAAGRGVTGQPAGPSAEDMDVAPAVAGVTDVVWFTGRAESETEVAPVRLADALVNAGVGRVICVRPMRGSRHPDAATGAILDRKSSFSRGVVVLAAAPVYGPGDELVSRLLIMMRSLPVVPLLANGDRRYQPIWHEDLAAVLLRLGARTDVEETYHVAGPDVVTQQLLYDRLAPLIDRQPARVPIPEFLTRVGQTLIDAASGSTTASAEGAWAVDADDALLPPDHNDLQRLLGRTPTSLETGLKRLVAELPEQLPSTGVGTLEVKQFRADISGTPLSPAQVLAMVCERFAEIMPVPVGVEPGAPATRLTVGATVSLHLPGRGHVQVRVEAADQSHVVLSTLRGHTLAGVVRFLAAPATDGVRFEVMTCDKAATPLDWIALTLGGARLQDANWRTVVARVGEMAGGRVDRVRQRARRASEAEAEHLSTWVRRLIEERERAPGTQ